MRALYIGCFDFPDNSPGTLKVISYAKILKELGYTVDFASQKKTNKNKEYIFTIHEGFEVCTEERAQTKSYLVKKMFSIKLFHYMNTIHKYDLIIAYNPQSISNVRMNKWCCKHGVKYLVDIDEWDEPLPQYPFLIRQCVRLNIQINMRYSNKKAHGLIVVSEYLKEYYKNQKVIVLPPLVDCAEEKWNTNNIEKREMQLVYFGSGGKIKEDLKTVVNTVSKLKEVNLIIVGITQAQYENDYLEKHEDFSNIVFTDRVTHEEALKIVGKSRASIILRKPIRKNNAGFPTKFVESISLGTPVICNDFSDVKKYSGEYINAYVFRNQSLEEALKQAFSKTIIVDKNTFDYHNFTEKVDIFLKSI